MEKQEKKMTKGEMERRMNNAIVLVPKDKDTKSIWFDDKGVRLTYTMDYAVFSTISTSIVFNAILPNGFSMPYIYIKRFVEIALENDCQVKDDKGNVTHSYVKLMAMLKAKEDKTDFHIAWYVDLWFNNIMAPLYSISDTEVSSFMVYEQYVHNMARVQSSFEAGESEESITNKRFVEMVANHLKDFVSDMEETVLFEKKSNEEKAQDEATAMGELNEEINGKDANEKK